MDKKNKDKRIMVRLDEDLAKAAEAKCDEENRTMSNLIRTALIAYLNK